MPCPIPAGPAHRSADPACLPGLLDRAVAQLPAGRGHDQGARLAAVVAIPAREEAERVEACLRALAAQVDAGPFGVVLLVNNSADGTAERARELDRALAPGLPFRLAVAEVELAPGLAHAGMARRLALDAAAAWLERDGLERKGGDGLLLTTDADSRPAPDWIARARAAVAAGADAVAGTIALDAAEAARLSPALHRRGAREAAYERVLGEIAARLAPDAHDPWPRHATRSGANLAVTLPWYRAVGGLPVVPLGEDKALAGALVAAGARLRHAPDVHVVTSGRLEGRAPGGAADTMRLRQDRPDTPCDPALHGLRLALRRGRWRARLRALHGAGRLAETAGRWAGPLGLDPARARALAQALSLAPSFAAVWDGVEAASPRLAPVPLRPAQLPARVLAGRLVLAGLRLRDRLVLRRGVGRPAAPRAASPEPA